MIAFGKFLTTFSAFSEALFNVVNTEIASLTEIGVIFAVSEIVPELISLIATDATFSPADIIFTFLPT